MDFENRIYSLREILEEDSIDGILIENVTDIYYLTGIQVSVGKLIIHNKGAHFIVDGRYYEAIKDETKFLEVVLAEPDLLTGLLLEELAHIKSLAFCSEKTTYQRYTELQEVVDKVLKEDASRELEILPADDFVLQLRSIKSPEEIKRLSAAAALGSKGYDYVVDLLSEGITELEVARELDIFWKKHGSEGLAFDPIVAFGPNSAKPHHHPDNTKLQKGMPVLIDIGVKLSHYNSDMTRVVFFGEPESKMQEIYEIVKQAQEAALKLCKPGTRMGDLDMEARMWITDRGYGKEFSHGLGHGVGLEVHELPVIRSASKYDAVVLQPGMVITVEPGIYLGGLGGVRIEDAIVITEEGHSNLTNRPKELKVI